ncbi:hypothetical protein HK096_004762 [Nowakowskiella sp. JEL0078]|nr:hypothetical protein HK096_004762 [Nowakowskiella sp. JEL0078]
MEKKGISTSGSSSLLEQLKLQQKELQQQQQLLRQQKQELERQHDEQQLQRRSIVQEKFRESNNSQKKHSLQPSSKFISTSQKYLTAPLSKISASTSFPSPIANLSPQLHSQNTSMNTDISVSNIKPTIQQTSQTLSQPPSISTISNSLSNADSSNSAGKKCGKCANCIGSTQSSNESSAPTSARSSISSVSSLVIQQTPSKSIVDLEPKINDLKSKVVQKDHLKTPDKNGTVSNGSSKIATTKKSLAPDEINNLIKNKLGQLENEVAAEDEEDKSIARSIKKASKDVISLIGSIHSPEQKLEQYHTTYMELFQEYKKLERDGAKLKRKYEQLSKEKDSIKADFNKTNLQKQKIEMLCRELQKENKRVKEHNKQMAIIEEQKREELLSKFDSTTQDFKRRMEEDSLEKRKLLKKSMEDMQEQFDARDKQFEAIIRGKNLEIEKLERENEQAMIIANREGQRCAAFKLQLLSMMANESNLRLLLSSQSLQVKLLEEKSITTSETMEMLIETTKKFEKEIKDSTLKCETLQERSFHMAREHHQMKTSLEAANTAKTKLERLCRTLHTEQKTLYKKLQEYESPKIKTTDPIENQHSKTISSEIRPKLTVANGDTETEDNHYVPSKPYQKPPPLVKNEPLSDNSALRKSVKPPNSSLLKLSPHSVARNDLKIPLVHSGKTSDKNKQQKTPEKPVFNIIQNNITEEEFSDDDDDEYSDAQETVQSRNIEVQTKSPPSN